MEPSRLNCKRLEFSNCKFQFFQLSGCWPTIFKQSNLCPIQKKPNGGLGLDNLRGISLANNYSRILEKHLSKTLSSAFDYPAHFGFSRKKCMEMPISSLDQTLISSRTNGFKYTAVILADCEKAFPRFLNMQS